MLAYRPILFTDPSYAHFRSTHHAYIQTHHAVHAYLQIHHAHLLSHHAHLQSHHAYLEFSVDNIINSGEDRLKILW